VTSDPDPRSVVEAFLAAANAHDREVALALLADDYVFREAGSLQGMDRDDMADLFAWDEVIESRAHYEALEVSEGEIRGIFSETNALYRALGIPRTSCQLTFRLRSLQITEQIIEQVLGDGPSFEEALAPFLEWLEENSPEDVDRLLPDGALVFSPKMARRWLVLLDRWRADGAPGRIGG